MQSGLLKDLKIAKHLKLRSSSSLKKISSDNTANLRSKCGDERVHRRLEEDQARPEIEQERNQTSQTSMAHKKVQQSKTSLALNAYLKALQ